MNFAIIGSGLIGRKRADALQKLGKRTAVFCDTDISRAESLAKEFGGRATAEWADAVRDAGIEAVCVCTTHEWLSRIACEALKNGKHVLLEKPAGRNEGEVRQVMEAAKNSGKVVRVGFNHRFHPAIKKAGELCMSGAFGKIMHVRGVYGHGGRPGYEKEWRADPRLSGGGEMLDQGSHLVDLGHVFLGKLKLRWGECRTSFWKMPVEDNAFAALEGKGGQVFLMHASWTEWKNRFLLEIFCEKALLRIEGLGKSYGAEKLSVYKMREEMGIPDEEFFEFSGPDRSFEEETGEFVQAIEAEKAWVRGSKGKTQDSRPGTGKFAGAGIKDALASIRIVGKMYRKGKMREWKKKA